MPDVVIAIVLNYLEAAHCELTFGFMSEEQTVTHVLEQRSCFIREQIKDPFLDDHVFPQAWAAHPADGPRLVVTIGDKTSYVFGGDRQMKHEKVVVFLSLTKTAVVICFAKRDVAFHLFGEGDAGLRESDRS